MSKMQLDSFDYSNSTEKTNAAGWLRNMPFAVYGYVHEVIDALNVRVVPVVQENAYGPTQLVDITLLSVGSGAMVIDIEPQMGDLVLMLSLKDMHPAMFNDPADRLFDANGIEKEDDPDQPWGATVQQADVNGYTWRSMVGILMRAASLASDCKMTFSRDAVRMEFLSLRSFLRIAGSLDISFTATDNEQHPVNVLVGPQHPVTKNVQSPITIRIGFSQPVEGDEEPVDAPVSIALSEKAPVSVGCGAPIKLVLGEQADIGIESKAGLKMVFEKAMELVFKGAIGLTTDSTELVTFGNQVNTLGAMVSSLIETVANLQTVGSPANHTVNPGQIAELQALKAEWDQVFG